MCVCVCVWGGCVESPYVVRQNYLGTAFVCVCVCVCVAPPPVGEAHRVTGCRRAYCCCAVLLLLLLLLLVVACCAMKRRFSVP